MEIWSGVTDPSQTHRQTTEYSATQLVLSLKFKPSHARRTFFFHCDCCSCQIWSLWGTVTWPTAPWGQKFGLGKNLTIKTDHRSKFCIGITKFKDQKFCHEEKLAIKTIQRSKFCIEIIMMNIMSMYCSDSLWTFLRPVFRENSVCMELNMFYSNDFCSHDCGAHNNLC